MSGPFPQNFRSVPHASAAESLRDGVILKKGVHGRSNKGKPVLLPWVAFGTYKLGQGKAYSATLNALRAGYRCIDTAFIYAGEKTEKEVGKAIEQALAEGALKSRQDLFVITKHWRKYHGYDLTKACLAKSLKRLGLDYVDAYLIHWPGPAYSSMSRENKVLAEKGPWAYATTSAEEMPQLRADTWRAMEDLLGEGKTRAIGVSNFTIQHLETLRKTAKVWPPAINQVECHPLYPNNELRDYCSKNGIVLQAYSALGGQDGSKRKWAEVNRGKQLLECDTVCDIAKAKLVKPSQILLRYALQRDCAIAVKTATKNRLEDNGKIFNFALSPEEMQSLDGLEAPDGQGRLCWRNDPLRMLDFE